MDSETTFKSICEALNFHEGPGLVMQENAPFDSAEQTRILRESWEKFGVDAVYFVQMATEAASVPVIFFKRLESPNPDIIRAIHRRIWNQGRVHLEESIGGMVGYVINCEISIVVQLINIEILDKMNKSDCLNIKAPIKGFNYAYISRHTKIGYSISIDLNHLFFSFKC